MLWVKAVAEALHLQATSRQIYQFFNPFYLCSDVVQVSVGGFERRKQVTVSPTT